MPLTINIGGRVWVDKPVGTTNELDGKRTDLKHNIRIIKEIAKDTGRLDNHKNIEIIGVVKGKENRRTR